MVFRVVKGKIAVFAITFVGVGSAMPIFTFMWGYYLEGILYSFIWLIAFIGMIEQCLVKRIIIDSDGIRYVTLFKQYKMAWSEISIIGIGYVPIKAPGRPAWIYFSAIDRYHIPYLSPRSVGEGYFMVHRRQSVIDEVLKYWSGGIMGDNNVSKRNSR